jgi:hypothetical protein
MIYFEEYAVEILDELKFIDSTKRPGNCVIFQRLFDSTVYYEVL